MTPEKNDMRLLTPVLVMGLIIVCGFLFTLLHGGASGAG